MDNNYQGEVAGATLDGEIQAFDKATLDGIGESFVVEIFNPLSVAFRVKYSRSIPQAFAPTEQEKKAAELIGAPLSRPDSLSQTVQYLLLEPGKTMRLPGNVAQVAVRQLVTEILQRRGQRNKLADGFARKGVEDEIVLSVKPMMDWVNQPSPQTTFDNKLAELNNPSIQEVNTNKASEEAFPSERANNQEAGERAEDARTTDSGSERGATTATDVDSSSASEPQESVEVSARRSRPAKN